MAAKAGKELIWLCCLLSKLHEGTPRPTRLYIDNHAATKHINVQYHVIRECTADRSMDLQLIGTNNMAANVLTKGLAVTKHEHFHQMLGMETMP